LRFCQAVEVVEATVVEAAQVIAAITAVVETTRAAFTGAVAESTWGTS
jgi:hypothetical protein